MAKEASTNHKFGEKPYLGFEHVTMVPMCRKLIDEKLLSLIEKDWLNKYHAEIFEKTPVATTAGLYPALTTAYRNMSLRSHSIVPIPRDALNKSAWLAG